MASTRLRRALTGDLETTVAKTVRPEADRRYRGAAALADDVRRHLTGRPVLARPDTWRYRTGKFVRRNPLPLSLAGALVVALGGFGFGMNREARTTATERDRAEAVTEFVTDLLRGANPFAMRNDSVLVREVLDRGAERVRTELTDEPVVRATLMSVMADSYWGLGLREEARALRTEALELRRGALGAGHPDVGASMRALARSEADLEGHDVAAALLEEATAHARASLPPGSTALSVALGDIGHVWLPMTEWDRAEPLLEEAVDLLRQSSAPPDRLADDLSNLGHLRQARGDLESAEAMLREVVEIRVSTRSPDDFVLAGDRVGLAQLLVEMNELDEAERLFDLAIGREAALPPGHPNIVGMRAELAGLLRRRGDNASAIELWREAIAGREAYSGGALDVGAASYRNDMALALRDLGRLDEAESELRTVLASHRSNLGDEHLFVGIALGNLGSVLSRAGRWEEAIEALLPATRIKEREQPDHWGTAQSHVDLGIARFRSGDYAGALDDLRTGVDLSRAAHPGGHNSLVEAEIALGMTRMRLKEYEEGERLLLGTLDQVADRGPDDPYVVTVRRLLVQLYTAWGKMDRAEVYRGG